MEINFVAREVAEAFEPQANWALIGLVEPGGQGPIETIDKWKHSLVLECHDADPEKYPNHKNAKHLNVLFTKDHAKQIIAFVNALPKDMARIVVHCEAGVSRSAAVAQFIGEFMIGGIIATGKYGGQMYNRHIFSTLLVELKGPYVHE